MVTEQKWSPNYYFFKITWLRLLCSAIGGHVLVNRYSSYERGLWACHFHQKQYRPRHNNLLTESNRPCRKSCMRSPIPVNSVHTYNYLWVSGKKFCAHQTVYPLGADVYKGLCISVAQNRQTFTVTPMHTHVCPVTGATHPYTVCPVAHPHPHAS